MSGVRQIIKKPAKLTQAINQDEWILASLNEHLGHTNTRVNKGAFYPSNLGNPCNRMLYLAYNGLLPQQFIEPTLQRIFDCGDALGHRYEKYFADMDILIGAERVVRCEDPVISGRMDFVIKHKEHELSVVELKSINDRGFKALLDKPKADHLIQLQIYLHLSKIEHGSVLYENKNNQDVKAFAVNYDANVWTQIQERCYTIMGLTDTPLRCTGLKYCQCKGVS
jgi:hypothetical protein